MSNRRHQTGLALVSVLLTITILSLIAVAVLNSMRTRSIVVNSAVSRAQADASAQAGIFVAIAQLVNKGARSSWSLRGSENSFSFDNTTVSVTISPEASKIDINAAPESLLAALFASSGVAEDLAWALADRVADWRDPDDLTHLNGAETPNYLREDLPPPRNGPFALAEEIRQVLGFPQGLFPCIEPLITIYSGRVGVDASGSPAMRQIMAWAQRNQNGNGEEGQTNGIVGSSSQSIIDSSGSLAGEAFTITASVDTKNAGTVTRRAVVRLTGDRRDPYWIMRWEEVYPRAPKSCTSREEVLDF